ncbi:hypothetical protein LCGC14_2791630, partial [marine sediment metagenome]
MPFINIGRDTVIIIDRDNRSRQGHRKPRPFISAPTWELEGIVLKAYKKNALFWGHVWIILRERQVGTTGIKMSARRLDVDSIDLMRHYKVG